MKIRIKNIRIPKRLGLILSFLYSGVLAASSFVKIRFKNLRIPKRLGLILFFLVSGALAAIFFVKIRTKNIKVPKQLIWLGLILPFLYFGVLAVTSFATPVSTVKSPEKIAAQSIEFDYLVFPVDSLLYPKGTGPMTPGSGEGSFLQGLVEKIEFNVTGRIISDSLTELRGNLNVSLALRSSGQWEKELAFTPQIIETQSESGVLVFNSVFELPLHEARELGETIIEETQVRPREGLRLVIKSSLSTPLQADESSSPGESKLKGEYEFTIDGSQIVPGGELLFENEIFDTTLVSSPNHISLLGIPVTVSTGRFLFSSIFIVFALAAGGYFIDVRNKSIPTRSKEEQKLQKIRRRFGSRIVKAGIIRDSGGSFKVEVDDYRELLKLADELEKPIIEVVSESMPGQTMHSFYVVEGETLYLFRTEVFN